MWGRSSVALGCPSQRRSGSRSHSKLTSAEVESTRADHECVLGFVPSPRSHVRRPGAAPPGKENLAHAEDREVTGTSWKAPAPHAPGAKPPGPTLKVTLPGRCHAIVPRGAPHRTKPSSPIPREEEDLFPHLLFTELSVAVIYLFYSCSGYRSSVDPAKSRERVSLWALGLVSLPKKNC